MLDAIITDWGNVLFKVDHNRLDNNVKEELMPRLPHLIELSDTRQISPRELWETLNRDYFKSSMSFVEFNNAFVDAWCDINYPLFQLLEKCSTGGVKLAAITDISENSFYHICRQFPRVVELFSERIITSFEERALKKSGLPFLRARSKYGITNALFLDNEMKNVLAAHLHGFHGFLYDIKSAFDHALLEQYLKFLFPHAFS